MRLEGVYFIQRGVDGPIKIGKTSYDPRARLGHLQIASSERLYLIGYIRGRESDVHARFKEHRISGEWFRPAATEARVDSLHRYSSEVARMSLFDAVVNAFRNAVLVQMVVCKECVRPTDKIESPAGDYSLCERCEKSITSKTGVVITNGSRKL